MGLHPRAAGTYAATQGPDGLTGRWDRDECERMADRMQARIEEYAPDFASRIVARRVLGPHELQARDENLINGALGGGTAQPAPAGDLPARPRPRPGRDPGPGALPRLGLGPPRRAVHGARGANAARAVVAAARLGRL